MAKLKTLMKEGLEDAQGQGISPKDIYNFYFLWYTAVNQPKLVSTPYGKETMNFYLQNWKKKYVKAFKTLIAKQIAKYVARGRVDPDFPKDASANLLNMSSSELQNLMAKTFRSDMQRRNDRWNLVADFVTKLEHSSSPKDIFVYVNQLNNAVHNTQTKVMDKMPNYYSELTKAFQTVDKATNPHLQLKGLVDKDIRDLWDQDEEGDPHETDPDQSTPYTERVMMREGLEKILRIKESQESVAFRSGVMMARKDKLQGHKRDLEGYPEDFVKGYKTIPQGSKWDAVNDRLTQLAAMLGRSYGDR